MLITNKTTPLDWYDMVAFDTLLTSSSSTKASRRVGAPVLARNFGAPTTMVVLRGGMVASFAAFSIITTSFGCRKT